MAETYDKKIKFLEEMANKIRQKLIETLVEAGSGHSAATLGSADIFTALYFHILNHKPKKTGLAGTRPPGFVLRSLLSDSLCNNGLRRLFPVGRIENFEENKFPSSGTSPLRFFAGH